ncbi:MAG: type IV secretion system protein TraC [Halobacteriovoraceae bacterium]|nr:type IV secretion system protein TraC [Halobacteriovoraceae bacterium]
MKLKAKLKQFFGEDSSIDYGAFKKEKISKDYLDKSHFQELLPYRLYSEERGLYENKHSFGFTFEVSPLVFASRNTEEEIATLIKSLYMEGASIQFLLFADPFIDPILDRWSEPRQKEAPIFQKITEKKKQFFQSETLSGMPIVSVPMRNFRLFFSYSAPKGDRSEHEPLLRKLENFKKKSFSTLSRLSHAIDVHPLHLIQILTHLTSIDQTTESPAPKKISGLNFINDEVGSMGALELNPKGVFLNGKGETYFKMFQAIDLPEEWNLPFNSELIGDFLDASYRIPSPFFIHYGIHYPTQRKEELNLHSKAALLKQQFRLAGIFKKNPHLLRESAEHDLVFRSLLSGEKFVRTRLNIGLYGSLEKFGDAESTLTALYQKYGFKLQETNFFHLDDLIRSLPMSWGELPKIEEIRKTRKTKTTLTEETSKYIPMISEWKGNSLDGMPLVGRRGQMAFWDPFVSASNYNGVVIGASGSGKTVFLAELMLNQMAVGGRVFVLDLGRSFEKLCHLLDGQYLFFTKDSNLNLNPFSLLRTDGDAETLDAALNMVSSIIATMAMPMEKIDGDRSNILNKCVREAWRLKGKKATVDDIIAILETIQYDSELMKGATESLIDRLQRYSSKGEYKNFFYGEKKIDFHSNFVVIETEELKNMGDLQAVILQIFSLMISSEVFMGDREKRSLICIDEAWDLLKSPQMEGFIESMARRLRKYNGSLFVGTQGLKDFECSPGAAAAFKNSNWLVMLGRDSDSLNFIREKKIFELSGGVEQMLNSLRKGDGYSEAFIYDKGYGTFSLSQLRLDPFSLLLFSTKPEEFGPVMELKKQGVSIEEAIEWMIENKGKVKHLRSQGFSLEETIKKLLPTSSLREEKTLLNDLLLTQEKP